jgi:hypothetical protein
MEEWWCYSSSSTSKEETPQMKIIIKYKISPQLKTKGTHFNCCDTKTGKIIQFIIFSKFSNIIHLVSHLYMAGCDYGSVFYVCIYVFILLLFYSVHWRIFK